MPIVVNPGFVWPPDVDPSVSPDGHLTAIVDLVHAGVLLRADYSGDPSVARVRIERQDGSLVRSGNPAWAPGGFAHAYDHEAPLGTGVSWRAVPIHFDGTEGEPSEAVGVMIPDTSDGYVWLKSTDDLDKSMTVKIRPLDFEYNGRVETSSIAGAHHPGASWDVLEGRTSTVHLMVRDRATEKKLYDLLYDSGPLLMQLPYCAGVEDWWVLRDSVSVHEVTWSGYPHREYTVQVVEVGRPATTDTPLRMPGLSYDTVARDWATYDQLANTVESYNSLLARE